MAISRPFQIALVVVLILAGVMTALRVLRQDSAAAPTPSPAAQRPAPAERAAPAAKPPASPRSTPAKRRSSRPPAGVPAAVARALAQRKVVVLFFFQRGGADDRATRRAVAGVRGRGVAVFSEPIERAARYAPIVGTVGLSQAPAVVIINREGRARLLEGFRDRGTLAQDVADAR